MRLTHCRNENKGRKVKAAKHRKPRKGDVIVLDMRGLEILTR